MAHISYPINTKVYADISKTDTVSDKIITLVWVSWGEKHSLEAVASAWLANTVNRYANPNFRYRVHLIGRPESVTSDIVARSISEYNVEVIFEDEPLPSNPAMFDRLRMVRLAKYDTPVIYLDSDVYCFAPFDTSVFKHRLQTFAVGNARNGELENHVHGIIEEFLDAPSSVFYHRACICHGFEYL